MAESSWGFRTDLFVRISQTSYPPEEKTGPIRNAPTAIVKPIAISLFRYSLRLPRNVTIVVVMVASFVAERFNR